jgi:hypothetical protein
VQKNLTLRLDRETIRKARILAARRSTSISSLIAGQIEDLTRAEDAYELAERQALALLDRPLPLRWAPVDRASLHER